MMVVVAVVVVVQRYQWMMLMNDAYDINNGNNKYNGNGVMDVEKFTWFFRM